MIHTHHSSIINTYPHTHTKKRFMHTHKANEDSLLASKHHGGIISWWKQCEFSRIRRCEKESYDFACNQWTIPKLCYCSYYLYSVCEKDRHQLANNQQSVSILHYHLLYFFITVSILCVFKQSPLQKQLSVYIFKKTKGDTPCNECTMMYTIVLFTIPSLLYHCGFSLVFFRIHPYGSYHDTAFLSKYLTINSLKKKKFTHKIFLRTISWSNDVLSLMFCCQVSHCTDCREKSDCCSG